MSEWMQTHVAPDGTHHLRHGEPLYAARFTEVLSFHPPGLAAAKDGSGAFHIDVMGRPAYARRFTRTFGFYEGLAAVEDASGAYHVHPDASELTPERYAWCGNFQGGRCTVRLRDGAYVHLDREGRPAYPQRYAYAGDFRDGLAVVQEESGLHLHIDASGQPLNGRRFRDLDVFHKGFARARDERGWHHVDRRGEPLYAQRYAAVEPFYNGQARVEREDGELLVIDERGEPRRWLRGPLRDPLEQLSGDMVGFWRTQALCAAAELDLVRALPGTAAEVAERRGLHPERCARLLRALGELGVLTREGETWSTTERGHLLDPKHPESLHDAAFHWGRDCYPLWEALPEALRAKGRWKPPRFFDALAKDPERLASYHRAMANYAYHDYQGLAWHIEELTEGTVIDAGGGSGMLLQWLVQRRPDLRGVLLERPEVARLVGTPWDLEGRFSVRAGDLFKPWKLEADAVILARVLHDWEDADALRILQRAREALMPGGRLFVLEMVLGTEDMGGGLLDLHMLLVTGGRERTEADFRALLARAGFQLREVRRLPIVSSLLIAEPA